MYRDHDRLLKVSSLTLVDAAVVFGSVLEVPLTLLSRLPSFEVLVLGFERSALFVIGGGRCYLWIGRGHPWFIPSASFLVFGFDLLRVCFEIFCFVLLLHLVFLREGLASEKISSSAGFVSENFYVVRRL
ncbi:hypothetical protein ISN44_As13g007580 [Arabidopsis suecica]|uniref:Uncharacterized protein n=1 Tax=Arabidopsis suecica TaxID=45249 RepID=A0A8T1XRA6_ARASU|nr:hypothetical protein ISN44_As13g007580 [Arabidopsis suecica]